MLYAHVGMLRRCEARVSIAPSNWIRPATGWAHGDRERVLGLTPCMTRPSRPTRRFPRPVPWAYFAYVGAGRLEAGAGAIDAVAASQSVRWPGDARPSSDCWRMQGRHAARGRAAQTGAGGRRPSAGRSIMLLIHRACIYALGGDATTSVEWMERTVETGMPNYPTFARDRCFDLIRSSASVHAVHGQAQTGVGGLRTQDAIHGSTRGTAVRPLDVSSEQGAARRKQSGGRRPIPPVHGRPPRQIHAWQATSNPS